MNKYTPYHQAIVNQMNLLAKNPKVIFLGQQIAMGEDFYDTLCNIPLHQRRELPVAEEMQLGISVGLALEGYLPVSIFQRMDFLPRAFDQFVNHLNLIEKISRGLFHLQIIIRTTIGTNKPLDVGLQHNKNLIELMRKAVDFPIFDVNTLEEVNKAYSYARKCKESVIIVEKQNLYYA